MNKFDSKKIMTYSNLNTSAYKSGHAVALRFYYLLRHYTKLKDTGSGFIPKIEAIEYLHSTLGNNRHYIRSILTKYDGIYWDENCGPYIRLKGLVKLCEYFGLDKEGDLVYLPIDTISGRLTAFRDHIAYSFMARESYSLVTPKMEPAGDKCISRRSIKKIIGVTTLTQRRIEKRLGVKVQYSISYSKLNEKTYEHLPSFNREDVSLYDIDGDGEQEVVWQNPNRYTVYMDYAPHHRKLQVDESQLMGCKAAHYQPKMYYDDPSKAMKAVEQGRVRASGIYVLRHPVNCPYERVAAYSYSPNIE